MKNTTEQALLQPDNRKCRFYVSNKNSGRGGGGGRVVVLVVLRVGVGMGGEGVDDPGQTKQGGSLGLVIGG